MQKTIKETAKLYWPSRKRSPKRLIVLVEPKNLKGHDENFFQRFAPDVCPLPHFKIRFDATVYRSNALKKRKFSRVENMLKTPVEKYATLTAAQNKSVQSRRMKRTSPKIIDTTFLGDLETSRPTNSVKDTSLHLLAISRFWPDVTSVRV